jgi:hypothetical protein
MRKVRSGDPLRIPAGAYNAFVDAARAHRHTGQGFRRGAAPTVPEGPVVAHNASGEDVPWRGVVLLASSTPSGLPRFVKPDGYGTSYGIALEPIPVNGKGRIVMAGGPWDVLKPSGASYSPGDVVGPGSTWYVMDGREGFTAVGYAPSGDETVKVRFQTGGGGTGVHATTRLVSNDRMDDDLVFSLVSADPNADEFVINGDATALAYHRIALLGTGDIDGQYRLGSASFNGSTTTVTSYTDIPAEASGGTVIGLYTCRMISATGSVGGYVYCARPAGWEVANGARGVLAVSPLGVSVFVPAHHPSDEPWHSYTLPGGGEEPDDTEWSIEDDRSYGLRLDDYSRVEYDSCGDETLYGFYRTLTFDEFGHLVKVSAETRTIIDVPTTG